MRISHEELKVILDYAGAAVRRTEDSFERIKSLVSDLHILPSSFTGYIYKGYIFKVCKGDLVIVGLKSATSSGDYLAEAAVQTVSEGQMLNGIIDMYDFSNRDLNEYPITIDEVLEIKSRFTKHEIKTYFPELYESNLIRKQ